MYIFYILTHNLLDYYTKLPNKNHESLVKEPDKTHDVTITAMNIHVKTCVKVPKLAIWTRNIVQLSVSRCCSIASSEFV